ncbi:hypothetical protein QR77_16175 [Streptomyces sp. 150FB]|uniref:hypothetical protein n=1 Tax=Streptomyces sp. 150FB TaxID=1576605 RepID=UPI0005894EF0|nr:hypothetical protein [Streptomyces sp. 150FB]KIF75052.1 hypothetical protein QR77_16175 [Streptomyces sp. 150FB]
MTTRSGPARIGYGDPFVSELYEDIGRLITGDPPHTHDTPNAPDAPDAPDAKEVESRLRILARTNSEETAAYWISHEDGLGIPDSAYKTNPPYLFPEQERVRTFRTSMTTGTRSGEVAYSARGMELMDLSIVGNARHHIMRGLDKPAVIRLVPPEAAAPGMVMAYGMELIARRFGDPRLSGCVLGARGVDHEALKRLLDGAVAERRPVVIIGATSVFTNLCRTLRELGQSWELPPGSRLVDAGGHKLARRVTVDEIRAAAAEIFGIGPGGHRNLFGMTELASQLYDGDSEGADVAAGPAGERPKASEPFVRTLVRSPVDLTPLARGTGLLEVIDLCVIDRPCAVLTGDWGIAGPDGTAIVGRVAQGRPRGCSLALDAITTDRGNDA